MSMTYYAVTDDPNELAHFGIKGMKWGVRHDKPRHPGSHRPRSAAYKKAQNKLSAAMKNGIKAVEKKWKTYNSPINKQIRAERHYENQTNRALEKARKGKLKYGKLTDDQVYRITERLALERNARQLSEGEKTWGKRLRESIGEGVIAGVGSGVGRIVSEKVSRRSTLKTDRMRSEQQLGIDKERARQQMKLDRERERRQLENERDFAQQRARNKVNQEYYEEAARRGQTPDSKLLTFVKTGRRDALYLTPGERARQLREWNDQNERAENEKKLANLYSDTYTKVAASNRAKLDYPESNKEKKKDKNKNKDKNKDKGPGASTSPISINFYSNGEYPYQASYGSPARKTDRKWREEERARRAAGRGTRPKNTGRNDWHGDLRPPTGWGQQDSSAIPLPGETINAFVERQRRNKRTGRK